MGGSFLNSPYPWISSWEGTVTWMRWPRSHPFPWMAVCKRWVCGFFIQHLSFFSTTTKTTIALVIPFILLPHHNSQSAHSPQSPDQTNQTTQTQPNHSKPNQTTPTQPPQFDRPTLIQPPQLIINDRKLLLPREAIGGSNIDSCRNHACSLQQPCLNGGRCLASMEHYSCECLRGFRGVHCAERKWGLRGFVEFWWFWEV